MSVSVAKPQGLAQALCALQSERTSARELDAAARVLGAHIERVTHMRRATRDKDEIRQRAMLKLMRTEGVFRGDDEGAARGYLAKVAASVHLDLQRAERRHHVRMVTPREGEPDPVERAAAPEPDDDTWLARDAAALELLDSVRDAVERRLESSGLPCSQRDRAWKQAQATLLMRLGDGMDARKIAEALGVPEASSACVHKWVERGRDAVLAACDELDRTATAEQAPLLAKLRSALAKRRKDAGKPRLSRRKAEKGRPR